MRRRLLPAALIPVALAIFISLTGPGGAVELGDPPLETLNVVNPDEGTDFAGHFPRQPAVPTSTPQPAQESTPLATPTAAPAPQPAPEPSLPAPAPEPTPTPAPKLASLSSAADTFVREVMPDLNSGDKTKMTVRSHSGDNYRSFVRFDVSAVPAGSTVNSATLTLCAVDEPARPRTYEVRRVTGAWGETTVTWNNQPAVAAAATDTSTTPTVPACMTWDVSSDVQAWVNGTSGNFGWRVSDQSEDSAKQQSVDFATKEGAAPGEGPRLEVTYTP